jgi:hypothetical protein
LVEEEKKQGSSSRMPQLFIKHLVCKPWDLTVAVGKKASQFKQNAATLFSNIHMGVPAEYSNCNIPAP